MQTIESVSSKIIESYDEVKNWRKVGARFGITGGMAFRIAKEKHNPTDPHIRAQLGLPAFVPTEACAKCGDVHTLGEVCTRETPVKIVAYRVSPEELASIDTPVVVVYEKSKRKRSKPRARASIATDNPLSAAKTILSKMSAADIQRMIAALQKGD